MKYICEVCDGAGAAVLGSGALVECPDCTPRPADDPLVRLAKVEADLVTLRGAMERLVGPEYITQRSAPTAITLRRRRLRTCVEAWPECYSSGYDPRCCRFPKSCSCEAYDSERVPAPDLEDRDGDAGPAGSTSTASVGGTEIGIECVTGAHGHAEGVEVTSRDGSVARYGSIREMREAAAPPAVAPPPAVEVLPAGTQLVDGVITHPTATAVTSHWLCQRCSDHAQTTYHMMGEMCPHAPTAPRQEPPAAVEGGEVVRFVEDSGIGAHISVGGYAAMIHGYQGELAQIQVDDMNAAIAAPVAKAVREAEARARAGALEGAATFCEREAEYALRNKPCPDTTSGAAALRHGARRLRDLASKGHEP